MHSCKSFFILQRETHILILLIESLRQRNHITIIIIGNGIKQLFVVLAVLIGEVCIIDIIFLTTIAPFCNIVAIKPHIINRNFLFDDVVIVTPSMQFCIINSISTTWSNPVTISERTFLHIRRNTTIHCNSLSFLLNSITNVINSLLTHRVSCTIRCGISQLLQVAAINIIIDIITKS